MFVVVPVVEMSLLIWAGTRIGLWWTLAIVLATGVVGAVMVQRQGLRVWRAARRRLSEGELPTEEVAHGAMLLVAGAFLITPGLISDATGLALLVPAVRETVRRRIARRLGRRTRAVTWR